MNKTLIATALIGILGAFGVGCSPDPCTELADAIGECGGDSAQQNATEESCTDADEKRSQCYLDNVGDVCEPTADELTEVDACIDG